MTTNPEPLHLETRHQSLVENEVRDELVLWIATLNLEAWAFAKHVMIDDKVRVPTSHPQITLNCYNRGVFLLGSYLHEQLHWWMGEQTPKFVRKMSQLWPSETFTGMNLPKVGGEAEHVIVCGLELHLVKTLVNRYLTEKDSDDAGEEEALEDRIPVTVQNVEDYEIVCRSGPYAMFYELGTMETIRELAKQYNVVLPLEQDRKHSRDK